MAVLIPLNEISVCVLCLHLTLQPTTSKPTQFPIATVPDEK